jgi:hypothetical protein
VLQTDAYPGFNALYEADTIQEASLLGTCAA